MQIYILCSFSMWTKTSEGEQSRSKESEEDFADPPDVKFCKVCVQMRGSPQACDGEQDANQREFAGPLPEVIDLQVS